MNPKPFLWLITAILLVLVDRAETQQPVKVAKIGWLGARSASAPAPVLALFRRELRALGYVEGKNIVLEIRLAEDKPDRLVVDDPDFLSALATQRNLPQFVKDGLSVLYG